MAQTIYTGLRHWRFSLPSRPWEHPFHAACHVRTLSISGSHTVAAGVL